MKVRRPKLSDVVFLVIIVVLIIPQTRKPVQVTLHSLLAKIGPSIESSESRKVIEFSNWPLIDIEGNTYNFEDFDGEVILLNFWATWCPPCIAELPSIEELYEDYNDKIQFVLISDESTDVIDEFLNTNDYPFKVFKSLSVYPNDFDVTAIPRTFLIDKSGTIYIDKSGAANWNSTKVRALIDQLLLE